jgi:hypothetical protein
MVLLKVQQVERDIQSDKLTSKRMRGRHTQAHADVSSEGKHGE